jgi:hypothetical protein
MLRASKIPLLRLVPAVSCGPYKVSGNDMRREAVVLGVIATLAGCGGGGGGSTPTGASTSGTPSSSDTFAGFVFDKNPPESIVDEGSMAFLLSLSDRRDDPFVSGPRWEITSPTKTFHDTASGESQMSLTISSTGGGYTAQIASGRFTGSVYSSDLVLPAASLALTRSSRPLQGFNTTQFEGAISLSGDAVSSKTAYAMSIQLLTDSGIGTVGMGHWKHLGTFQPGYFQGIRNVHGAFLIGKQTVASQISSIPTGSYIGFSQAGAEAYYYDSFDQVTSNAVALYDASTHTITLRLSGFNLRSGTFGYGGQLNVKWQEAGSAGLLPASVTCSGQVSPSTGQFTCRFATVLSGQIKGKFFGDRGQVVAGTYELSGSVASDYTDAMVGGFIAQRHVSTGEPLSPPFGSPPWKITPEQVSVNEFVRHSSPITLHAVASGNPKQAVYAVALDDAGSINPDVSMMATAPNEWNLTFSTWSADKPKARSGELRLRMCYDDPLVCARPVPGSPWTVPYQINTLGYPGPNPTFTPEALEGVTYVGQSLSLSTSVTLNETSVIGASYGHEQYRYTVVDSGILVPTQATGTWYNQIPSAFAGTASLGFMLKPKLVAGIYDGKVTLSICGLSMSALSQCLAVDSPTIEIPYHVEVKAAE